MNEAKKFLRKALEKADVILTTLEKLVLNLERATDAHRDIHERARRRDRTALVTVYGRRPSSDSSDSRLIAAKQFVLDSGDMQLWPVCAYCAYIEIVVTLEGSSTCVLHDVSIGNVSVATQCHQRRVEAPGGLGAGEVLGVTVKDIGEGHD